MVGRIVGLADAFDAMTPDRPYHNGMPQSEALELIEAQRGQHWDPKVVDAPVRALPKVTAKVDGLNRDEWNAEQLAGRRRTIPHEALEEIAKAAEEAVVLAELSGQPNVSHTSQKVIELLLDTVVRLAAMPPHTTAAASCGMRAASKFGWKTVAASIAVCSPT